jgi:arabinan endo-1,5-alpha-L-arabinosidase
MKLSDIHLRDPFVLPVPAERRYYLYGTTDPDPWRAPAVGFDAWTSEDLEDWHGPIPAFRPAPGFWSDRNFWAPEVHEYRRRFCMFASFKSENRRRATQILGAPSPAGPFRPLGAEPLTPPDWECLDGTLHVDRAGKPWLVFCHEWVQVGDGEVRAVRLTEDLGRADGEPLLLFTASGAPWVRELVHRSSTGEARRGWVTDGPFLFRPTDGGLLMLWSSFGERGYAMGIARSESGEVAGPWRHEPDPVVACDGGHGMLFRSFDGGLHLTYHAPNRTPEERPVLVRAEERDGSIALAATAPRDRAGPPGPARR